VGLAVPPGPSGLLGPGSAPLGLPPMRASGSGAGRRSQGIRTPAAAAGTGSAGKRRVVSISCGALWLCPVARTQLVGTVRVDRGRKERTCTEGWIISTSDGVVALRGALLTASFCLCSRSSAAQPAMEGTRQSRICRPHKISESSKVGWRCVLRAVSEAPNGA